MERRSCISRFSKTYAAVIFAAGIMEIRTPPTSDLELWERTIAVNLAAPAHLQSPAILLPRRSDRCHPKTGTLPRRGFPMTGATGHEPVPLPRE